MSCCGGNRGKVNVNRYRKNTKKTNESGKSVQKKDSKIVSKQLREK
ncbi:MAG: hypothetical protein ACXABO_13115 [Promethearchaeota archaeon]|jgi:hypothetical protein